MNFTYPSSLGSAEFRLLRPVSATHHALHFTVLSVPRAAAPPYTAASYTWGEGEASEIIFLDDRIFHVRPNLWSCLYYLSLSAKDAAWKYIWVDAVCIDQCNNEERSLQVRLMDQTYKDATYVSVWLGLIPLPDEYSSAWDNRFPSKTIESDGFDWRDSMADLSNRPYWSRLWVIQEFLLGQDVELHCSNTRMNWLDFQAMLCDEAGIDQFGVEHDSNFGNGITDAWKALPLVMGRHPDKHPEVLQPLHHLLVRYHRAKCKDWRDKVFALLGLITLDERRLLERFFPDYSMSDDHVRIITLAHLTQFISSTGRESITPDSEELFLGLGVDSRAQRRRLLRRAKKFDYFDDGPPSELISILSFHNGMEEYDNMGPEEMDDIDAIIEPPRPGRGRRVVVVVIALGLGVAALWAYRRR
ncbi:heterokaryon incompatibility protein-domain-containing protein [Coniochaeta sp. 2T2.1]|nr:heterokaryon incompatibility protein-domain-containing protein [Coniochaeta sp. 2T2.1]